MSVGYPDPTQSPYSAVVKIFATFSDGVTMVGSGVMVGRNDVLTAEHVVNRDGFTLVDLGVYSGWDDGPGPHSFINGDFRLNYPDQLLGTSLTDEEAAWDMALVGLSSNLGDVTGWLEMRPWAEASSSNHLLGYPAGWGFGRLVDSYPGSNAVSLTDHGNFSLAEYTNTGGMSGGPMLDAQNRVLGVNSTTAANNRLDHEFEHVQYWIEENDEILVLEWPVAGSDEALPAEINPDALADHIEPYPMDGPVPTEPSSLDGDSPYASSDFDMIGSLDPATPMVPTFSMNSALPSGMSWNIW